MNKVWISICGLLLMLAGLPAANAAPLDDGAERYRPYMIEGIGQALVGARNLRERVAASDLAGAKKAWISARAGWEKGQSQARRSVLIDRRRDGRQVGSVARREVRAGGVVSSQICLCGHAFEHHAEFGINKRCLVYVGQAARCDCRDFALYAPLPPPVVGYPPLAESRRDLAH